MKNIVTADEVDAILLLIENEPLPHVHDGERRFAVMRTVEQLGITSRDSVKTIAELIDTNEAQLAVHSDPSDPSDD